MNLRRTLLNGGPSSVNASQSVLNDGRRGLNEGRSVLQRRLFLSASRPGRL